MKNSILKIGIILLIILSMTMTNFVFVGKGLISYAAESTATNHQNIEFEAYFKDKNENKVTTLEKENIQEETFLYLNLNVKKEGYFNGEISLENSNFVLKDSESEYVNKIENNTIYLNQINVGAAGEIKVRIEPIKEDLYDIGLLNLVSKINLKGIYRDRTEKDINIKAEKEVNLKIVEQNTEENIQNEMQIITNKIAQINGQEKRIIQFTYTLGLKENNYPIKEINSKIAIPTIDEKQAEEVKSVCYFNNMTAYNYSYDGKDLTITLKNDVNNENKVRWKTQGVEKIIVTCVYDKDVEVENIEFTSNENVTLYNNKTLETKATTTVGAEEIDNILQINSQNTEESIYKGKLNAGIARQYQNITELNITYASAISSIELKEEASRYIVNNKEIPANVIYNKTTVKKDEFNKIFGEEGIVTIYNQNGETLGTITNASEVDLEGNITISYEGKNVTEIYIRTTTPVKEGILKLNHTKTIQEAKDIAKNATELKNKVTTQYNTDKGKQEKEVSMKLEDTVTESKLEVNREDLSTVISNNVEMKVVLMSSNEKYDLYTNPQIAIQLPEQVENITINSIDFIYENELSIKNYRVEGKTIYITLEGSQTQYHEDVIDGSTIVINANLTVNKKSATKDAQIQMTYTNQDKTGSTSKAIKIVAPKDITTIYNIQDLGIETLGQEETKQVKMEKSADSKQLEAQMEIINNNEHSVEGVKILGDLPTNNANNNMGIQIVNGITVTGTENAKVYYSENSNATDSLENAENGWTDSITDNSKVTKFLIATDEIPAQSSVQTSYKFVVPANLEYNQVATTKYTVKNTDSQTKIEDQLNSTSIEMQTGIGPEVQVALTASKGGQEITTPVKNGEVIKYNIEVKNTGTEDINDVSVKGNVPEGTTFVQPEEHYEYTGASYYKEFDYKTYEGIINTLKVGESINVSYEVRVNNDTKAGTILKNQAEIKYGEVTKQTEEIEHKTTTGNIRVTVKRITDRNVDIYTSGSVQYFAIIENISNEKQEDVKVKTNLSEGVKVDRLVLTTDMEVEGGEIYEVNQEAEKSQNSIDMEIPEIDPKDIPQTETLEYKDEINIGTLEPGQNKVLSYDLIVNNIKNEEPIGFSVEVIDGKEKYESNSLQDKVKNIEVNLSMTSNTQNEYVKSGDTITYTITLENKTTADTNSLIVKDSIPKQLSINKITVDGQEMKSTDSNEVEATLTLAPNGTNIIEIETVVDYSQARSTAEPITNVASAELFGKNIATTASINHIIEADNEETSDPTNPNNPSNPNDPNGNGNNNVDDNNIAKGNKTIMGTAWYDENANGKKEQGEKLLNNIKVKLLNVKTNNLVKNQKGQILEATTNENGIYVLDKIANGEYIVIFEYDNVQYALTKYKVEGVGEAENSDALSNKLLIENETKEVASTDILTLNNQNISNINIGLIKLQKFDLQLNKSVSRILIQNASGTAVREYQDASLAKVEVPGKDLNGSTVIIEYKISVTNKGEIEGYAKKIADYIPSDLKFSSELNKDWYQTGNTLYTDKLANEKIKAGETKTVVLTLTKAMTENNTGSVPNIAEIAEAYNELGIKDINSTPGNREKTENDYSSAETIISVKTGEEVVYTGLVITIIIALGIVAVVIAIKKKNTISEM